MFERHELRRWLLALAICALLCFICYWWVDRRVVDAFELFLWTPKWLAINRVLGSVSAVFGATVIFLLGCGLWVISRRTLPSWTRVPLLCVWSGSLPLASEMTFKAIFGRLPPYPGYLRDHLYTFRVFSTSYNDGSFPSGTATTAVAVVSVLWLSASRLRAPALILCAVICGTVIVLDYHWVSDVIAGVYLGALVGRMTMLLGPADIAPQAEVGSARGAQNS